MLSNNRSAWSFTTYFPIDKSYIPPRFIISIAILITPLLLLASCYTSENQPIAEDHLVELIEEHQLLQKQYEQVRQQLQALDAGLEGNLTPKEIVKNVIFFDQVDTLERIQDSGRLSCGSHVRVYGFGNLNPHKGRFDGFYIDFCQAVMAAIFGQDYSDSVKIVPVDLNTRFSTLQSGEIDVLFQSITWTLSRDTTLGFEFGPIIFYDGQGLMIHLDSQIYELEDFAQKTICVLQNTTSEQNIIRLFADLDIEVDILTQQDLVQMRDAYEQRTCLGMTTDKSILAAQKVLLAEPDNHEILDMVISREPLAPVVRQSDDNWHDVIFWTVQCTINAEYLGVNQKNIATFHNTEDPDIQQLLGSAGNLGEGLGLPNDFCYHVIAEVGNYGDIYERHFGLNTAFKLTRGPNALFNNGGILYPIPFR